MKFNIRLLYLYLFSFVGLLTTIIGSTQLVDLGLKTFVFKVSNPRYYSYPVAEGEKKISDEEMEIRNLEEESNETKRQMSNSLSMIFVGVPIYLYHWQTIKKEK